jgi:hypothetical protein
MEVKFNFRLPKGGTTSIMCSDILAAHENTKASWVNVFTSFGEILVKEDDFHLFLIASGVKMIERATRFNPSTEANLAGVETPWEEGEKFTVWHLPRVPVLVFPTHHLLMLPERTLRLEPV